MGNKPNNFIQCGFADKDNNQETNLTRQQAIRKTKQQQYPSSTFVQSKITKRNSNISSSSSSPSKNSIFKTGGIQNTGLKKKFEPTFIPEHQNIVRVTKTPKNQYLIYNSQLYEEQHGKCLDQIIQSRYNTSMHFPQNQIVGLLESLVYSLAYLTKKDINYHDFYPTNIFYNNGVFKILNPLVVKLSGYALTQRRKRFSFLSPQLILQILNDKPQLDIKKDVMDKSDVFAIGMIMLEFCTLMPSSECYDPETYSIVDATIQQRVDKTSTLYNPLISQCIDLMLQYQVDKRITPLQLAYAVHFKIMQIKEQQINEISRVKQMSRMAMSAKIPNIKPQVIQAKPVFLNNPPTNILINNKNLLQNPNSQHYTISSNPKIYRPYQPYAQTNINILPFPKYPTQAPVQVPAIDIPRFQPQLTYVNNSAYLPHQKVLIKNSNVPLDPTLYRNDLNLSPKQRKPSQQRKYYITSQTKLEPTNYLNKFNLQPKRSTQQQELQRLKLAEEQTKISSLNSNIKYKLNPFEQIKQDIQQKEQSPQNYKKYTDNSLKQTPNNVDIKQIYTFQPKIYQGQSLDERVKRILQASKNIK